MNPACTQTLYAPNPPQLDELWVKIVLAVAALLLAAALAAVS